MEGDVASHHLPVIMEAIDTFLRSGGDKHARLIRYDDDIKDIVDSAKRWEFERATAITDRFDPTRAEANPLEVVHVGQFSRDTKRREMAPRSRFKLRAPRL